MSDQTESALGAGGLHPRALQVTVSTAIKAEELHAALDKILELHGHPQCGLSGVDVRFRPEDEMFAEVTRELPNVTDISRIRHQGG